MLSGFLGSKVSGNASTRVNGARAHRAHYCVVGEARGSGGYQGSRRGRYSGQRCSGWWRPTRVRQPKLGPVAATRARHW